MMQAWLSVLVVVAAVGSCDPVQFKNPLTDAASAKRDSKLEGTWGGRDSQTEFVIFIQGREDEHLDVLLVGRGKNDGVAQVAWDGVTSTVAGKTYLNLREKHYTDTFANKYELAPTSMLVRYELSGTSATFSYLPGEGLEGVDGGSGLADAPSTEVAALVQRLPAKAFRHFITVKRFKVP